MSAPLDPVREYLRLRGCPPHVVERGLEGLIAAWAMTADEVAGGYRFGLDDYRNDVDARQLIEDVLPRAPDEARDALRAAVELLDERVETWLEPQGACVWGEVVARAQSWTPERNWWYFRWPRELAVSDQEAAPQGE